MGALCIKSRENNTYCRLEGSFLPSFPFFQLLRFTSKRAQLGESHARRSLKETCLPLAKYFKFSPVTNHPRVPATHERLSRVSLWSLEADPSPPHDGIQRVHTHYPAGLVGRSLTRSMPTERRGHPLQMLHLSRAKGVHAPAPTRLVHILEGVCEPDATSRSIRLSISGPESSSASFRLYFDRIIRIILPSA